MDPAVGAAMNFLEELELDALELEVDDLEELEFELEIFELEDELFIVELETAELEALLLNDEILDALLDEAV